MFWEQQPKKNPRAEMNVLLIILGGLGDWCIRRALKHAMVFEKQSQGKVTVVVVDVHPRGKDKGNESFDLWIHDIDRMVVRRLIEQCAEDVDQPLRNASGQVLNRINLGFTGRLAANPELPDPTELGGCDPQAAIDKFVASLDKVFIAAYYGRHDLLKNEVEQRISKYLESIESEYLASIEKGGDPEWLNRLNGHWKFSKDIDSFVKLRNAIIDFIADQAKARAAAVKIRLEKDRHVLTAWLQETVFDAEHKVHRYWRYDKDNNNLCLCSTSDAKIEVDQRLLQHLALKYRIIVYAAVPPQEYPLVLEQWSAYAERIALEKPVAGLLEKV